MNLKKTWNVGVIDSKWLLNIKEWITILAIAYHNMAVEFEYLKNP